VPRSRQTWPGEKEKIGKSGRRRRGTRSELLNLASCSSRFLSRSRSWHCSSIKCTIGQHLYQQSHLDRV
jgi:hypothetical protein